MENVDNILTFLRIAFRNLEARKDSFSDFASIERVYNGIRTPLMKEDKEDFESAWSHYSGWHTGAFDTLIEEAFIVANVTNYNEFMEATGE